MSPIAASTSYLQTLLYDLGRQGHVTGSIALPPGKHAVYDGRYIDIAPKTRAHVAVLPVNPYVANERSPGLIAYMSPVPVLRLPPNVQTHLGIKSVHLDSLGEMRLQGELGGARRRLLNYTHGPLSLAEHLKALNKHFMDICAKVVQHPVFSDVDAFNLQGSDLTWALGGGPTVYFDAEDRLPFCGLRSDNTEVLLRPEYDETTQTSPLTLRVNHRCTLLATGDGPDRTVVIELFAALGASRPHTATERETAEHRDDSRGDAAAEMQRTRSTSSESDTASDGGNPPRMPGASAPNAAERAKYCAAIYAGLLNAFDVSGHFSLEKQDWTDVATLFPKAEAQVRGWRMQCRGDVTISMQRRGDDLHLHADGPIRLRLPEGQIPVSIGWLRRLLSRLLVVSIQEASIKLADPGDVRDHLPFMVQNARLQLGWIPLPFVRVNRQFNVPLPPPPDLFAHIDRAAAQIAQVYTFSPLVNLSHLTDLSQSDLQATSDRYCQCALSERYALHARATSLHLGRSSHHPVGGRIAIDHEAYVVGYDEEQDLHMGAAFSIEGGALLMQPFVGEDPPGPAIRVSGEDGIALHATLGPEATHALARAAVGGLKGLAVGSARVCRRRVGAMFR